MLSLVMFVCRIVDVFNPFNMSGGFIINFFSYSESKLCHHMLQKRRKISSEKWESSIDCALVYLINGRGRWYASF